LIFRQGRRKEFASDIEAERRLVEANPELIAQMESKIAAAIARTWGDGVPAASGQAAEPKVVVASQP